MYTDNSVTDEQEIKADDESADGIGVKEARIVLGDLVARVSYGNERIVLTKHGKRAAALVPMRDLLRLRALDGAA